MSVLGQTVREALEHVETFPKPDFVDRVTMTTDEFTALCPVTGQPDYCTVTVEYVPKKLCIESKSMKLYLYGFRNKGSFCEDLSREILEEVLHTVDPYECRVVVDQKPRGGIALTSEAFYVATEPAWRTK